MATGFTTEERQFVEKFKSEEYGQAHLFDESFSYEQQKQTIQQLKALEASLPKTGKEDALLSYINRAKSLLAASAEGANPYEGYTVETPVGVNLPLDLSSSDFLDYEIAGLQAIHKTAFVIVAGGLGERLGYDGIKLELPVDLVTGVSHLQWYIETILAYQANAPAGSKAIPIAIMTSDDTHIKTEALLAANNYFGAQPEQITIVKQAKVPALTNNAAAFAHEKGVIETKPHGHGDVHSLLVEIAPKWAAEGIEHVAFVQDTNSLIFNAIPATLGVSIKKNFVMNTVAVDRKPGEAVGAIAKLTKTTEDGKKQSLTINVEYNQLAPLYKASGAAEAVDAKGFSLLPGNTNSFIVNLKRYAEVLKATGGVLGEFVNPKYADETKTEFKSSARLESLMQDLPKALTAESDIVGFTKFERWMVFSAVKNSVKDAAAKQAQGLYPECALSAEADRYACYTELLKRTVLHSQGSFEADAAEEQTFFDVTYSVGPKVVIHPTFASSVKELLTRVAGAKISLKAGEPKGNCVLILQGNAQISQIGIESGALIVSGGPKKDQFLLFIDEPAISNRGWYLEPTVGSQQHVYRLPAPLRIRGYTLHKAESRVIHASFEDQSVNKKKSQKFCC